MTTTIGPHDFVPKQYNSPTSCACCGKVIWGVFAKTGVECKKCSYPAHKQCQEKVPADCTNVKKAYVNSFQKKKIGVVKYGYNSMGDDELSLQVGDQVVIVETQANNWSRVEFDGTVGLYPTNYLDILPEGQVPETKEASARSRSFTVGTVNPATPTPIISTADTENGKEEVQRDRSTSVASATLRKSKAVNKNFDRKLLEGTATDPKKVEKIEKLLDEIEGLPRKDFTELGNAFKQYLHANEKLSDASVKISSEMGKLAERYKETQFFVKFMELAEDFKKIDSERVSKINPALIKASNITKEIESDFKKQGLEKKIKDANKKMESHLKKQTDNAFTYFSDDQIVKSMGELQAIAHDIDQLRDQMISQLEHTKSSVVQTGVYHCSEVLLAQQQFLEYTAPIARLSVEKWNMHKDHEQAPVVTWENPELKTIAPYVPSTPTPTKEKEISKPLSPQHSESSVEPPRQRDLPKIPPPVKQAPPLPPRSAWNEYKAPDGRYYYHNTTTGQTQWNKPSDF